MAFESIQNTNTLNPKSPKQTKVSIKTRPTVFSEYISYNVQVNQGHHAKDKKQGCSHAL